MVFGFEACISGPASNAGIEPLLPVIPEWESRKPCLGGLFCQALLILGDEAEHGGGLARAS
jgi:hypothetical protein